MKEWTPDFIVTFLIFQGANKIFVLLRQTTPLVLNREPTCLFLKTELEKSWTQTNLENKNITQRNSKNKKSQFMDAVYYLGFP